MGRMITIAILSLFAFACQEQKAAEPSGFGLQLKGLENRPSIEVAIQIAPAMDPEKAAAPMSEALTKAFSKCQQTWPEPDPLLQVAWQKGESLMKAQNALERCLVSELSKNPPKNITENHQVMVQFRQADAKANEGAS